MAHDSIIIGDNPSQKLTKRSIIACSETRYKRPVRWENPVRNGGKFCACSCCVIALPVVTRCKADQA